MTALYEQYRPASFAEVVGQSATIAKLEALRKRGGLAGRAYWLSGASGTGKTTISRLIAAEVADSWSTEEFTDPSEVTAAVLNDIRRQLQLRPFGKGYCYILNEAHGAGNGLVRKLLGLTESLPAWVTWCFTTTSEGQKGLFEDCIDASPLLSRCTVLALQGDQEAFAQRVRTVAVAAGIDGQPIERYRALVANCNGNVRAALQAVESGEFQAECERMAAVIARQRAELTANGY